MQGFIIAMNRASKEDMIVRVLSQNSIQTLYRFYGVRHSIINIGRKIDYEIKPSIGFLPKLHNMLHLAYKWEFDADRYHLWQSFIKMLDSHLKDIEQIDSFYFDMLQSGAHNLTLQNPKRVMIEMQVKLLDFEGRSSDRNKCFVCEKMLDSTICLGRAFLFAHPHCVNGAIFNKDEITNLLDSKQSILLDDIQVARLWEISKLGL